MRYFNGGARCQQAPRAPCRCHASVDGSSVVVLSSSATLLSLALAAGICSLKSRSKHENPELKPSSPYRVALGSDCSVDVVLSSGFLSFANHSGFLQAIEEAGLQVHGLMGTSAGALSGALYAAGYSPQEIATELSKNPPSHYLQMSNQPWQGGVLNMSKAIQRYRELLPATFEDLPMDFAVGVYARDGTYHVVDSGPLPEAVVASAAIPFVFENVDVPGVGPCMDGGKFDRVGLDGWRARCSRHGIGPRPAVVHLISRSSPFSGSDDVAHDQQDVIVVRSPKSGVSLASLGNFDDQFASARARAQQKLEEAAAVAEGYP